jgi:hypothetical protein
MHERGLADEELIDDSERDRFADVAGPDPSADADRDGHTADDRARAATDRDSAGTTPAPADRDRAAATPGASPEAQGAQSPDYQRGREDEKRLERDRLTEDVRESDRSRTN